VHHSLVDIISEQLDSITELTIFTVKDLDAQFLLFYFFFTSSLVTLELIDAVLLLFLNVVLVSDV
jgi:hypothetical protein